MNTLIKYLLLILILFLIVYYYKYLKLIIKPVWLFILTVLLAWGVVKGILLINQSKKICLNRENQPYQILVIRDTILQNDINITLGKIQNHCLKNELILIRSGIDEEFKINDVLSTMSIPKDNSNKSNPFDMLFFGRVNYQLNFVTIEKLYKVNKISLSVIISNIRDKIDQNIKSTVGLKNYNLVSMWLLGKSKINDQELNNLFKNLGISHILVVSGTHLSILFNVVSWFLVIISPSYGIYLILVTLFLVFFLFLAGFSSSILRATVFWMLIMLGKINGKIINYTNVLLLILLIVFMINPLVVVYDLGFHLSFLSIVALIYILPIIQAYFKCNNKNLDLVFNIFSATIAIMVLLMPYLMYWFSEFNLLSIIFNIILIPLSGLILSVALLTAILSFLQGWVAQFLGWLVYWLVNIFLLILNWLENVSLNVNVFFFDSIVLVIIYYAVLLILVIDFYKKNKSLTINI